MVIKQHFGQVKEFIWRSTSPHISPTGEICGCKARDGLTKFPLRGNFERDTLLRHNIGAQWGPRQSVPQSKMVTDGHFRSRNKSLAGISLRNPG
jgi:hypothetical protein